jgi:hypothetical protein
MGFDSVYKNPDRKKANSILSEYSWQGQASVLEKVLKNTKDTL